jgi:hypothetical protein
MVLHVIGNVQNALQNVLIVNMLLMTGVQFVILDIIDILVLGVLKNA